jgi:hypothetical protein
MVENSIYHGQTKLDSSPHDHESDKARYIFSMSGVFFVLILFRFNLYLYSSDSTHQIINSSDCVIRKIQSTLVGLLSTPEKVRVKWLLQLHLHWQDILGSSLSLSLHRFPKARWVFCISGFLGIVWFDSLKWTTPSPIVFSRKIQSWNLAKRVCWISHRPWWQALHPQATGRMWCWTASDVVSKSKVCIYHHQSIDLLFVLLYSDSTNKNDR